MPRKFDGGTWSAEIPDDWDCWTDDECTTFAGPSEIGSIQISAYSKRGEVLDEDLRGFAAEKLDAGLTARNTTAGDYNGFEIAFADGDLHMRQWYLRRRMQMLFVTYTCDLRSAGLEDGVVAGVLASLRAAAAPRQ